MATTVLSLFLGLIRTRISFSIYGASNTLGAYNYASILPDTIFQLVIAAALASAFIPVFSDYLVKGKEKEGHKMASTLLSAGLVIFGILSLILAIFAPQILAVFNIGQNFTPDQMQLMAQLMRLIVIGQLIYIVAAFLTALLQSYNHFFIPGIAAACYNVGIIIGILLLHTIFGIYAIPIGIILGAILFVIVQVPLAMRVGFSFRPDISYLHSEGVKNFLRLMWPRTIQVAVQQSGTVAVGIFVGFMLEPLRLHLLYDAAKTLMFAPVSFIGVSMAQAAFPILSRERNRLSEFKSTFMSSFNQMLYLILPVSAIILVLRIPIVRLAYGADKFDWDATVLTGQILALLSISIFAQALLALFYRAFYALHNTMIPLITSVIATVMLIIFGYIFVVVNGFGIGSIAIAWTIANIVQILILFILLDKKVGKFEKWPIILTMSKYLAATIVMGVALYIPIKLLDQLVFDTTKTINLIFLTGISGTIGLLIYLFLTWLLNIQEVYVYLAMIRRLGNWREILGKSDEVIDANRTSP